jgi:integrase
MMQAVETYLALRRTAGFELKNADYLLHSFARFASQRGDRHIRTKTVIDWASQSASMPQRDARLKTVCRFARYLHAEEEHHELPPADHFGYRKRRRTPFIYSRHQICCLIEATSQLGPPGALLPKTYATLIGLLAATGMRVSEALALRVADSMPDGLLIRQTKFHKSRLVPLHETAVAALQRYLRLRQLRSSEDPVFVGENGRPLRYWAVHATFQKLLKMAGLWPSTLPYRPRLHDLRHAFAVRALEAGPAGRERIGRHMVALATYLGHVNINATYWYLEATPELLQDVARAAEAFLLGEPS